MAGAKRSFYSLHILYIHKSLYSSMFLEHSGQITFKNLKLHVHSYRLTEIFNLCDRMVLGIMSGDVLPGL